MPGAGSPDAAAPRRWRSLLKRPVVTRAYEDQDHVVGETGDRIDVAPSTMPPSESLTARVVERIWPEQEQPVLVCWVRVAAAAARRRFWRPAVRARESRELAEMGFWLYQVRVMPEMRLAQPDAVRRQRQKLARRVRDATAGLTVTRLADGGGVVSFAGTPYACGRRWARAAIDVSIVAGSVQLAKDGKVIRVHPIRHDRARESARSPTPKDAPAARTPPPEMSPSYRNSTVTRVPEL